MPVRFQSSSFKVNVVLTRNEQSLVTFFSAKRCHLELMEFICLADQQPNRILITPATLGRTLPF